MINVAEPRDPSQGVSPQTLNSFGELGALHEEYRSRGVEILAFPCDQFAQRSPSKSGDVGRAWVARMGFGFMLMDKIRVNGDGTHPLFELLKSEGPDVRGPFQTAFLVAFGAESCQVWRFEGLPPRALRSRIDELLQWADKDAVQ